MSLTTVFSSFLGDINTWDLNHLYGRDATDPSLIHQTLQLSTTGDGTIVSPFDGTLSVKDPLGGVVDSQFPYPKIPNLPVPTAVPLYLQIDWAIYLQKQSIQDLTRSLGVMQGFVFIGIDPSTVEDALGAALDQKILRGDFGPAKQRDVVPKDLVDKTATRDQAFNMLITGNMGIKVKAGQVLGKAVADPNDATRRVIDVATVTNDGLVDPIVTFRNLGPDLVDSAFLTGLERFAPSGTPTGWPVVDPQTDPTAFITETTSVSFPNPALEAARRDLSLSLGTWRQIRDNQKALYRAKLLALVGQSSDPSAPRFEFDTLDWRNPFQLEAVVEFYANYANPWANGAVPLDPSASNYQPVDFQNFEGFSVTASGSVLTFPPETAPMFAQLVTQGTGTPLNDTLNPEAQNIIELDADTNPDRPNKRYRVTKISSTARTMTLDAAPALPSAGSPWTLFRRTVIVLIDFFGGRLSGTGAQVVSEDVIQLERPVSKVNPLFDTICLAADVGSPSRAYRIVKVLGGDPPPDPAVQFQVVARGETGSSDVHPDLGGGSSSWRIPAGVSSALEPLGENLGINSNNRGWDHCDAMLFVVKDGRVAHQARWSTFTSRNNGDDARRFQASVGGNVLYRMGSVRSNKKHLNWCFRVTDRTSSDRVQKAFYYFDPIRKKQAVGPDEIAKAGIRIHTSASVTKGRGNWSAGCLTSVNFAEHTRGIIIELYQQELIGLGQGRDAAFDRIQSYGITDSIKNATDPDLQSVWDDKIVGWCWVIRPDELPNGWMFSP
jgi:hypothetical protein